MIAAGLFSLVAGVGCGAAAFHRSVDEDAADYLAFVASFALYAGLVLLMLALV